MLGDKQKTGKHLREKCLGTVDSITEYARFISSYAVQPVRSAVSSVCCRQSSVNFARHHY